MLALAGDVRYPMRMGSILLLAALVSPVSASAAPARFDPIAFFTGATEGTGRMKILLGPHRTIRVHGRGHVAANGVLVLDQTVERENKPPQHRQWRIRPLGQGRYTGTLSDARGPVTVESVGNRLRLAYKGKAGVSIEQRLVLAPDGRSAQNRLTARRLGAVVARLDETIRKVD